MNFQQLRYVREAVRQNLNLTEAASALYTSQSGVSKQIKDLEDELGVDVFVRRGKRLTGLTEPGRAVLQLIERMLLDAENLRRVARQFADQDSGHLVVATTHTQARYALPQVIKQFTEIYPKVHLALRQGSPRQISQMVIDGEADIGITTEALDRFPDIVTFPCYSWHHVAVVPKDHPLVGRQNLTLEDLAEFPIITYDGEFTGRSHVDKAFADRGLVPDIVLTALDTDVIKTYVEVGLGVGIVAAMAVDPRKDSDLAVLALGDQFEPNTTRIGLRRGAFLRAYAYRFIEMLAPTLNEQEISTQLREALEFAA
ncbi:transcriptional regulator [Pandoraea terrae]|uniref:Transcriptional regulator n=1 Tax=Pandoraea terrae TaxID=1537710 RepID=A0A5E4WWY1_9BURK|nr:CysB family HTH-type transcriptional regulator [Pandoraea terrae]VVE28104.1 transcriptional regulator [Pandoraea terrae]